jgi:hypothetical protein
MLFRKNRDKKMTTTDRVSGCFIYIFPGQFYKWIQIHL